MAEEKSENPSFYLPPAMSLKALYYQLVHQVLPNSDYINWRAGV